MAISVDATRPKADVDSALALSLALGTVVEDDAVDTFVIPVNAEGLTIPDFSVTDVAITSGSDILTTTGDGFASVEVGDSIAAVTGLVTTTVLAKTDNNNIQVADEATVSGTETLTFTPAGGGAVDITIMAIKVQLIKTAGGSITAVVTALTYDGSLQGTEGDGTNNTSEVNLNRLDIDIDSILETARIPRTN